jgi:hypothetical protein
MRTCTGDAYNFPDVFNEPLYAVLVGEPLVIILAFVWLGGIVRKPLGDIGV